MPTFAFCTIFLWLCADLPLSCLGPAIPAHTKLQVRFHLTNTASVKGGSGQSHTEWSKIQIAGKWCLRPQAPCLCCSSKFRHGILPTFLFSHQQHHIMSDMNQEEGAAQGVNYHLCCSVPWMCSCKHKAGTCWMNNNSRELGEASSSIQQKPSAHTCTLCSSVPDIQLIFLRSPYWLVLFLFYSKCSSSNNTVNA